MGLLVKDFQKFTWLGGRGVIEILIGVATGDQHNEPVVVFANLKSHELYVTVCKHFRHLYLIENCLVHHFYHHHH